MEKTHVFFNREYILNESCVHICEIKKKTMKYLKTTTSHCGLVSITTLGLLLGVFIE